MQDILKKEKYDNTKFYNANADWLADENNKGAWASGSRSGISNSVSDSEYTGSNSENASNNAKKYFHLIYSSYFISNFQAYIQLFL